MLRGLGLAGKGVVPKSPVPEEGEGVVLKRPRKGAAPNRPVPVEGKGVEPNRPVPGGGLDADDFAGCRVPKTLLPLKALFLSVGVVSLCLTDGSECPALS